MAFKTGKMSDEETHPTAKQKPNVMAFREKGDLIVHGNWRL